MHKKQFGYLSAKRAFKSLVILFDNALETSQTESVHAGQTLGLSEHVKADRAFEYILHAV